MKQEPKSADRYSRCVEEMAFERLRKYPEHQARAIAAHYVQHATVAMQLQWLLDAQRASNAPGYFDAAIAHHVAEIKRNHRFSFGIELEWEGTKDERRG